MKGGQKMAQHITNPEITSQRAIERNPGDNLPGQKIIQKSGGFKLTQSNMDERIFYKNTELCRHSNGGGWVPVNQDRFDPKMPFVSPNALIGPHAYVLGSTRVFGGKFFGGEFSGGVFHAGTFRGGKFRGGEFHGGWFKGGEYSGGVFHSGKFSGGRFYKGVFRGDKFDG